MRKVKTTSLNEWVSLVETLFKGASYFHLKVHDYVTCIAISDDGKVPLVIQQRPLLCRRSIELPGGLVDLEMSPLEIARKELEEEVGIESANLLYSSQPFILDPGRIENKTWIFVFDHSVRDLKNSEPEIQVIWVSVLELIEMALTSRIDHLGHVAAILMCKQLGFFDKYLSGLNS